MAGVARAFALVAVGVLAVCVVGCGMIESPSARVTGVSLDSIDLESVTLQFAVDVTNPYPAALPLANLDYTLASKGATFLDGNAPLQGSVPAGSTKSVTLPARVTYRSLLATLSGVRPGQVMPYEAAMGLSVDAPVLGAMRLPLSKSGQIPVPAAPGVTLRDVQWEELSLSRAVGVVTLSVTNRNTFPVDLKGMTYALTVGGTEVADSRVSKPVRFDPGQTRTVEIPVAFATSKLGLGALSVLRGSKTLYGLDGSADFDTRFGPLSLPVSVKSRAD
ncbi:MAG: LEA type 2 family protein [Phycisphaerae bacterium]